MRSFLSLAVLAQLLSVLFYSAENAYAEDVYTIYFDADQTAGASSADAMYLGAKAAFAQNGNRLGSRSVDLVRLNHRGNPKRSWVNLNKAMKDETGLAVIGGVHSPPYITYRDKINEAGMVLLLPWSAGAPITRATSEQNSIFRVSVDDAKAGGFLASQVLADPACSNVVFLIWDSGWGRSNQPRLENAFTAAGRPVPPSFMFNTGLGSAEARVIVADIAKEQPDCAIIVGNMIEEATLLNELHAGDVPMKVYSHWGILLGDFAGKVPAEVRNRFEFKFVQTCALEREADGNSVLDHLFSNPPIPEIENVSTLADIPSAVGFVNAYDMVTLLIAAAKDLPNDGEITSHRKALARSLQGLNEPSEGILKLYDSPFAKYTPDMPDAHEALGAEDLCMARFDDQGRVVSANSGS